MKKKLFSILLTVAMVVTMMPYPSYALGTDETEKNSAMFSDMPKDWSTEALGKAISNGLLSGYDGRIMAKQSLTRAQMATIVIRAFGTTEMDSISSYTDVKSDAWYYSDMAKAVQMKIFIGNENKLNPNSTISREETFTVLARAFKLSGVDNELDQFSDRDSISEWARSGVAALATAGYIQGSEGKINPKKNITRAEFAKIMDNLVKNYITKAGTYTEDMTGNVIINVADVKLSNMKISGDLIIGDGVGDGEVTLDSVVVTGRTLIRGGGVNSIKITGNASLQNIVIARVDGEVRVYAEDGTEIGEITVDGNDDVIIEGEAGTVTITASHVTVKATNATIQSAIINGENSKIVVSEKSNISNVIVNSKGADISGAGKISKVEANADDVKVSTIGTKVTAKEGTTGVKAGTVTVGNGNTETVPGVTVSSSSHSSKSHSSTPDTPVSNATDASYFTFDSSTRTITDYNSEGGLDVVIPATIDGVEVEHIGDYAFRPDEEDENYEGVYESKQFRLGSVLGSVANTIDYNFNGNGLIAKKDASYINQLTSVSIPDSVKSLGEGAFAYNYMTEVNIPDSVTSVGTSAFSRCERLTNVNSGNGVISIGDSAFERCTALANVTIGEALTSMGENVFYNCNEIKKFTVHAENTSYSSSEGGVLFNKDKTALIKFPAAYENNSYEIPEGVITIGESAFEDCINLTGITLPGSAETISEKAFYACTGLTGISIPNGVKTIGDNAFYSCENLGNIMIPESVEIIGLQAFNYCKGFTSVTIEGSSTGTSIGAIAFSYCENLETVIMGEGVTSIGEEAFYYCQKLTSVTMPNTLTSIGDFAFYHCVGLTSIDIPASNKNIGMEAFNWCTGLTRVTIGDGVTIGNNAFTGGDDLKNIYTEKGAAIYTYEESVWEKYKL